MVEGAVKYCTISDGTLFPVHLIAYLLLPPAAKSLPQNDRLRFYVHVIFPLPFLPLARSDVVEFLFSFGTGKTKRLAQSD